MGSNYVTDDVRCELVRAELIVQQNAVFCGMNVYLSLLSVLCFEDNCENFQKETPSMSCSWGTVEEMDVNVIPGRPWKKHNGGDWAAIYLITRMTCIYTPYSGKDSFLSPASSSPFLVLLSLNRTKCDGIQFTTGLRAVDSQLWVSKK